MLDSRFVDALLRHFGNGSEHLCLWERDGAPQGMAILKPGKFGIWSTFLPPQAQVAPVIVDRASKPAELFAAIPGMVWQLDFLCQDPQYGTPLLTPAKNCKRMPHALTMSVRLDGRFDSYWDGRSKNLRDVMKSRVNRVAKTGLQPRVVLLEAPGEMQEAVERFGKLEMSGWKGRAGTAVSGDNAQGAFYGEILSEFAKTGQAVVYEYWLSDRLAASQLAITSDGMVLLLKTAYDEDFARLSPGRLLLREVIRDGFLRFPNRVVEFYTNANSDQLAWATDQRWIEHVTLYRNRAFGLLFRAGRKTKRVLPAMAKLVRRGTKERL